jgi:hypothetical protein
MATPAALSTVEAIGLPKRMEMVNRRQLLKLKKLIQNTAQYNQLATLILSYLRDTELKKILLLRKDTLLRRRLRHLLLLKPSTFVTES